MVEEIKQQGQTFYLCSLCGMPYLEREWAQKCEDFCAEHHACSLDIIEHAASLPETERLLTGDEVV